MNVAIVGATGYGGIELVRILSQHPKVSRLTLYTSTAEDEDIQKQYGHLSRFCRGRLQRFDPERIVREEEFLFFATPNGVAGEAVPFFLEKGMRVIDLSGDFRIQNRAAYEKWYRRRAAPEKWRRQAVYGLTEWNMDQVKQAQLVANPGCFPTCVLLGILPFITAGYIERRSLVIDAKTGISGAGKTPTKATHYSTVEQNFRIYKVHEHQHIPEIEQELAERDGEQTPISFSTHLVPMTRGIMATMYAHVTEPMTQDTLQKVLEEAYSQMPFAVVRRPGDFPGTKEVLGSNQCDIAAKYDERTGRITVVAVIDNLMKGASGQAVQNFNVMNGFSETLALNGLPVFP